MSGTELDEHQISIECEVHYDSEPVLPGVPVVTINPFVPSRYEADSDAPIGAFPTLTLVKILGEYGFQAFEAERHFALQTGRDQWPLVRQLFEYYLQGNQTMFVRVANDKFGLDWEPKTSHERTTVAYQAMGLATTAIAGITGNRSATVIDRFARKHTAAMRKQKAHLLTFRTRGKDFAALERSLFTELNRFVESHETWEMGMLPRFVDSGGSTELANLVLFRDEFSTVRDLYQQGFELACKSLWPLVAAQNSVKRGDPNAFGTEHPSVVPTNRQAGSLAQFDKLPNAYKVAYVSQVPGWESLGDLLNSKDRNTIGHATAHHDLQSGRVISDTNPGGVPYLEFLGQAFGVFDALATLAQVLRACRVAASPDFNVD